MKPTIGRIVIYNVGKANWDKLPKSENFSNIKFRNKLPAIVVGVNDDGTIDLVVFHIGLTVDLCSTDTKQGDQEGEWNWPVIEK